MKSNVTLFFSSFFQSSFPDGKLTPSHLYLFIKDLIVVIFPGFFLHEFTESNRLLKAFIMHFIDGIYCCFLVFYPIRRTYI